MENLLLTKSNFRDWTLDKIDDAFKTKQVWQMDVLDELLAFEYVPNEMETWFLKELQSVYQLGGDDWNEVELENKFISPLIVLSKLNEERYSYFLERELRVVIDNYDLSGKVDGMIATGFRNPKSPFFCLKEYKRQTDPDGDPRGQALIAMIAAQALNNNENRNADHPIYGCYVIGRSWNFMALVGKEYAISNVYTCTTDELLDIFRILKGIKNIIEKKLM
jgi:hypothetical protein